MKLEEKLEEARTLEEHVLAERERMRVVHRALREVPEFLETQARDRLDAGDHTVLIGHVDRVSTAPEAQVRVFLDSDYGHFVAN